MSCLLSVKANIKGVYITVEGDSPPNLLNIGSGLTLVSTSTISYPGGYTETITTLFQPSPFVSEANQTENTVLTNASESEFLNYLVMHPDTQTKEFDGELPAGVLEYLFRTPIEGYQISVEGKKEVSDWIREITSSFSERIDYLAGFDYPDVYQVETGLSPSFIRFVGKIRAPIETITIIADNLEVEAVKITTDAISNKFSIFPTTIKYTNISRTEFENLNEADIKFENVESIEMKFEYDDTFRLLQRKEIVINSTLPYRISFLAALSPTGVSYPQIVSVINESNEPETFQKRMISETELQSKRIGRSFVEILYPAKTTQYVYDEFFSISVDSIFEGLTLSNDEGECVIPIRQVYSKGGNFSGLSLVKNILSIKGCMIDEINEDFLSLKVPNGNMLVGKLIVSLQDYYKDKEVLLKPLYASKEEILVKKEENLYMYSSEFDDLPLLIGRVIKTVKYSPEVGDYDTDVAISADLKQTYTVKYLPSCKVEHIVSAGGDLPPMTINVSNMIFIDEISFQNFAEDYADSIIERKSIKASFKYFLSAFEDIDVIEQIYLNFNSNSFIITGYNE